MAFVADEEAGVRNGGTIMVSGAKVTRGGAAFANAEMMLHRRKWDTFRMLTHPGTAIIPAALVATENAQAPGRTFITGLAAGYEVMERMAADCIPTVMARGFHAGPVFSIFGAAIAAAKIMRLRCRPGARGDLAVHQSGRQQSREPRRCARAPPSATRCLPSLWRSKGALAVAKPCSKVRPASTTPLPGTTPASSPTASPVRTQHQPGPAHRRSRHVVDVPRDAVPHLLDPRLQHRPHRRDRSALRGTRHPLPGCRSRRGGR